MQVQARASRFHGAGSWPPALSTILKEVERIFMRQGYFISAKEFRGVCTSADGSYTKGAADECMRLLKNAGALVPGVVGDKSRLLIDKTACSTLQSCFEHNEQPHFPSLGELAKRQPVLLRALRRRTSKPKQTTTPAIAPVVATVSPAATVELSSTHTAPSQPTETPMTATALAPAVSTGRVHKPVPVPRFVAYLPSGAACEVWIFLYVCVTNLADFGARIAVPDDKLPDGVECSTAEFDEWLEIFVRAGVIQRLGESGNDNRAFAFKIHPDEIHAVEIEERKPIKVPSIWIDVANRARREMSPKQLMIARLRNHLARWVEANFKALRGLTASQKLMGYRPNATRTDTNWGIFFKDPNRDAYLPCLPGLEPYEFVPTDSVARRCKRKGKGVKQTPAPASAPTSVADHASEPVIESALEPVPVPAVVPALDPALESVSAPIAIAPSTQDLLARIREERQRLEEAERLLTALADREQRHAQLADELEALDVQIAADHARLDALGDLGFPIQKES